jgi:hypothetical protein
MRHLFYTIFLCCLLSGTVSAQSEINIYTQDLTHFWEAYDAMQSTDDSLQQLALLQKHFLDKASAGQKRMMELRRYAAGEYVEAIRSYPKFWESLRPSAEHIADYRSQLDTVVARLQAAYPNFQPADIYFTMGVFRSPGTGVDSMVLIGSEYALGTRQVDVSQLPQRIQEANYYEINPIDHLAFLVTHEFIHTQQKPMVYNLLSLTLYEGIAEFTAEVISRRPPAPFELYDYGQAHEARLKQRFEEMLFNPNMRYHWLWNSNENEFGVHSLGYYIGRSLAEAYYEQAEDKRAALRTLIELDYEDEAAVEALVDETGFFSAPLSELYADYEAKRPTVTGMAPFKNGSRAVTPSVDTLSLTFSKPMNTYFRGFDFGPMGEEASPRIQQVIGWSEDHRTLTFILQPLQPNKHYQLQVTSNFCGAEGRALKSALVEFWTGGE